MARVVWEKQVIFYRDAAGNEPFNDWLESLRDERTRHRIRERLLRVEAGNYGDHKPVGSGVFELRFQFGSGYCVYFGEDSDTVVVLLCGGDKSSQTRDIEKAKAYWKEYLSHV